MSLSREIKKIWKVEFDDIGLSVSHGYLLKAIADEPSFSAKELAGVLSLELSTTRNLLSELRAEGFIIKSRALKGAEYTLTQRGHDKTAKVSQVMNFLYGNTKRHLGSDNFNGLVEKIKETRGLLEEQHPED